MITTLSYSRLHLAPGLFDRDATTSLGATSVPLSLETLVPESGLEISLPYEYRQLESEYVTNGVEGVLNHFAENPDFAASAFGLNFYTYPLTDERCTTANNTGVLPNNMTVLTNGPDGQNVNDGWAASTAVILSGASVDSATIDDAAVGDYGPQRIDSVSSTGYHSDHTAKIGSSAPSAKIVPMGTMAMNGGGGVTVVTNNSTTEQWNIDGGVGHSGVVGSSGTTTGGANIAGQQLLVPGLNGVLTAYTLPAGAVFLGDGSTLSSTPTSNQVPMMVVAATTTPVSVAGAASATGMGVPVAAATGANNTVGVPASLPSPLSNPLVSMSPPNMHANSNFHVKKFNTQQLGGGPGTAGNRGSKAIATGGTQQRATNYSAFNSAPMEQMAPSSTIHSGGPNSYVQDNYQDSSTARSGLISSTDYNAGHHNGSQMTGRGSQYAAFSNHSNSNNYGHSAAGSDSRNYDFAGAVISAETNVNNNDVHHGTGEKSPVIISLEQGLKLSPSKPSQKSLQSPKSLSGSPKSFSPTSGFRERSVDSTYAAFSPQDRAAGSPPQIHREERAGPGAKSETKKTSDSFQ